MIDAAEAAREIAPSRTPEGAAYEMACADAAISTVRHAISLRNREPARGPLQQVAQRLGVVLDEDDPDWQRLAFGALRDMLEAQEKNLNREHGTYASPTHYMTRVPLPRLQIQSQMAAPIHRSMPFAPTPTTPLPLALDTVSNENIAPVESQIKPGLFQSPPTSAPASGTEKLKKSVEPGLLINGITANYIVLRSQGFSTFMKTE